MREISEVSVEKAILHMVSPGSSGLKVSERDVPLDQASTFGGFLARHVLNGLHDSQTRTAHFVSATSNAIATLCKDLILNGANLVSASQGIARALQTAIGEDQRITPGALIVAVCKAKNTSFLALMKLDPGGVFRPTWTSDNAGSRYLMPKEFRNALPAANQKLQKCAFVNPAAKRGDREGLLVLDRQVHGMPATFFLEGFLHAEPAYGPDTLTTGLYRAVQIARNRLEKTLGPRRVLKLDRSIDGVFSGTSVNVNEWLNSLPSEERKELEIEISAKQLDREITFDPSVLDKMHRKVRYEADNGVVLQYDPQAYGTTIRVDPLARENDNSPRYRVEILTKSWNRRGDT